MAKLGAFYSLCPLIEKNTLFVTNDCEDGVVIVTLGKNIASRYQVSDQRQLTCWGTKEKLSSPVFYSSVLTKYVAVFNQTYIKLWSVDATLDKLKKYKFIKPIHTLIKTNKNIYVVFQNGAIHNIEEALEQKKTLNPVGLDLNQIDDVLHIDINDTSYIGLISEHKLYWTKYEGAKCKFFLIDLKKDQLSIVGYVFHKLQNDVCLLTLWSDGSMFLRILKDSQVEDNSIGELFTVLDSVSSKHFISMKSLDENYIALYGANNNEEGAMLALYNMQFKVTQSRQPFKMFTTNSRIWSIDSNLLLAVGHNLAVVPFHLETEQLAALVGSHKILQSNFDPEIKIVEEVEISSWDGRKFRKKKLPGDFGNNIEQFLKQGYSECSIVEEILPDVFKKGDNNFLIKLLNYFTDIPEKYLVRILSNVLMAKDKSSNKLNYEEDIYNRVIPNILSKSFNEVLIIPYLRAELTVETIADLLKYLYIFWSQNRQLPSLSYPETHTKLLEWSCAVIDANYQKIVLSKNPIITENLTNLSKLVNEYLQSLQDLQEVVPLLSNFAKNKLVDRCLDIGNLRYSIEQISLY